MAAAYRSIATVTRNSSSGSANLVITKPSGLTAGDLMVAVCAEKDNAHYTSSGWTEILRNPGSPVSYGLTVLAKVASSGDAAASNFTFTGDGGTSKAGLGALMAISGTFTSSVNCVSNDKDTGGVGTALSFTGGVTPNVTNGLLIFGIGVDESSTGKTMSGYAIANNNPTWTERADFEVNSTEKSGMAIATATYAATGSTGTYSSTLSSSSGVIETYGFLIEVQETQDVSPAQTALSLVGSVPTVTPTGDANVTAPTTLSAVFSVLSVVVSLPVSAITNVAKHVSNFINQDKS